MAKGKGLKRLAFFVVFLIPVVWYLFLQTFGSNRFSIELINKVPNDCQQFNTVSVIYSGDSLSAGQINNLNRVKYRTVKIGIPLSMDSTNFFSCIDDQNSLALVSPQGLWGTYKLDREGVDVLLTELDVLLIQSSYGEGIRR